MGWISDNFSRVRGDKRLGTDAHGQPHVLAFRSDAVAERQMDELIGLVKGVLADGAICQGEVEFLYGWLNTNRHTANAWPANVLFPRIAAALSDGHVDAQEEAELMDLLLGTVGGNTAPLHGEHSNSTTLPLCKPAPDVIADGRSFCFTGKFHSGSRPWCQTRVVEFGGLTMNNVTKKLDYLVIGEIGSRDWLHSTHGLKIKKAVDYRSVGVPLHIISEKHWHESLR